jgi:hypothetical protein
MRRMAKGKGRVSTRSRVHHMIWTHDPISPYLALPRQDRRRARLCLYPFLLSLLSPRSHPGTKKKKKTHDDDEPEHNRDSAHTSPPNIPLHPLRHRACTVPRRQQQRRTADPTRAPRRARAIIRRRALAHVPRRALGGHLGRRVRRSRQQPKVTLLIKPHYHLTTSSLSFSFFLVCGLLTPCMFFVSHLSYSYRPRWWREMNEKHGWDWDANKKKWA